MGKLMIPDYRDDIEETILPDNDSEKEAQEADVKPAVADTSENRNEENNEEKDKGKNGISAVADRIFDFLVMAGQYFCHIIADVFQSLLYMWLMPPCLYGSIRRCSGTQ